MTRISESLSENIFASVSHTGRGSAIVPRFIVLSSLVVGVALPGGSLFTLLEFQNLIIKKTYHTDIGSIENFRSEIRNLILSNPKYSSLLKCKSSTEIEGFACKLNPPTNPYNVAQTLFLESIYEEGKIFIQEKETNRKVSKQAKNFKFIQTK